MLPSPGRTCHSLMTCSVILTHPCLLRQKPRMAIWDFFQKPRDPAVVPVPWWASLHFPFQDSQKLYINHFLASVSPELTLPQQPGVSPSAPWTSGPSSIFWNQLRQQSSWRAAAKNQAGNDWESQRCCWSFSGSPETVSRIQAVPDRTGPHTRCAPALPSLQVLLFWEWSLSLSNPAHRVTTPSCSLCNGLRLPGHPHHTSLWEPAGIKELWRPHILTSPPQTLWADLSQVLNSPEEQTQTHQGGIWFFLSTYCGPAILHLWITLSLMIILIFKQTMPEGCILTSSFLLCWALPRTCVMHFQHDQSEMLLFEITCHLSFRVNKLKI